MDIPTLLRIFLMGCLWGPSFLLIKMAVSEVPPLTAAALRASIAALFLLVVLKIQRKKMMPFGSIWRHFAFMGFVASALPFCCFCFGEIYIDSSLAALINGAPPIFTAILAHFFLKDEPITVNKVVGVVLGILGLAFIFVPNLSNDAVGSAWGVAAIVLAVVCYAIAFVYAKVHLKGLPPLIAPASQLLMASLYLIPLSLLIDRPYELPMPSWSSIAALLALGIFGTGVAFIFYYKVLETAGAMALSMVSYLLPVFGMSLGILILNEPLTWNGIVGGIFILAAMAIVNGVFKLSPALKSS